MPSNTTYFEKFHIKLNLIKNEHPKKKEKNTSNSIQEKINFLEILKLTGIFKINEDFFAIINGDSYPVGAVVNGYKILSIDIHKVMLSDITNNEKVVLKIEN
jgi:hypothetical protein